MDIFLEKVVQHTLQKHKNLDHITFVLPSKRAGVFLKDYFKKHSKKAGFLPEFSSIESFVENISSLQYGNNTMLLFELYKAYCELQNDEEVESFYNFSKWAQTLLQDFNEIDRYLVDPETIFPYIASVQEMNHWSTDSHHTILQKQYLHFWNSLGTIYQHYKTSLSKKGIGYQGMVYKDAIEQLEHFLQHTNRYYIFVGFNALNEAEEKIIQELLTAEKAEILWDIDKTFVDDKEHDAGLFIRKHLNNWKHFNTKPFHWYTDAYTEEKNIKLVGVPKNVGQTKYVRSVLEQLQAEDKLQHSAVVLGNEALLTPMLNEILESIEAVNITMGLPLQETPLSSWFTLYFKLYFTDQPFWYYKEVLDILVNNYSQILIGTDLVNSICKDIQSNNKIKLDYSYFTSKNNIATTKIFTKKENLTAKNHIDTCLWVIYELKTHFELDKDAHKLQLEYLYRFYNLFNQLATYVEEYPFLTDVKTIFSLYKTLISSETLDFQGEPLDGLQIMGMLESRNLDFETVILTSVNEGILPSGKSNNSFIPFEIKRHLNLPTYKEKDAIYTYHFYRLLQRAKNIYIIYNTDVTDALKGNEKSRFITQLIAEKQPNHSIEEVIAAPQIEIKKNIVTIEKDDILLQRLEEIASKGFSPSSLTNYVRNPIDFYKQSVLKIRNQEEVEETIAANTLGTIIHNTLETLYKPYEAQLINTAIVTQFLKEYPKILIQEFEEQYKGAEYSQGKNLLIYNVAKNYVERFLKLEIETLKHNEIHIVAIEHHYEIELDIPNVKYKVTLQGKVDRVDKINGDLRIVDYKSGKVMPTDLKIKEFEVLINDYKYSKAFQVLAYAYMYYKKLGIISNTAGIISFKNLKEGFMPFTFEKNTTITVETIENFEIQLKQLISDILDPSIPFTEKEV